VETKQAFCVSCSAQNSKDHKEVWAESLADYAILLRAKEFGYTGTFDRIIREWRTHVLPECNPLALS
jgi:hypothetical protein